jgi:hypothetical protein
VNDNPSAHKALSVQQFLAQKLITEMELPSYSPNLDLNNFRLSLKIMSALEGQTFQDTEDIQENVTMALKAIPQQEFQIFSNGGSIVGIAAQREYFKGNPSQ